MAKLGINDGKGFHITFDNGVVISVQIGRGNYSDNYNFPHHEITWKNPLPESSTAEIACWMKGEKPWFFNMGREMVAGYVPINRVVSLISALSALPNPVERSAVQNVINSIIELEIA